MRIAIPVAEEKLSSHFGHCEEFHFFDIDPVSGQITNQVRMPAPPHEPGVLPRWLAQHGVTTIIAGGIGVRAQQLCAMQGIKVITGAVPAPPRQVVSDYLAGTLQTGENLCQHD